LNKKPGNEKEVADFLLRNIGRIELRHVGVINKVQGPSRDGQLINLSSGDIEKVITEQSGKKADIFINGRGVSIKQKGAANLFNRLQRAEILRTFELLGLTDPNHKVKLLDEEIERFHKGLLCSRDRDWFDFFDAEDFSKLLDFLMMKGSPNLGFSKFPAEFIIEAPSNISGASQVNCLSFHEYYMKYRESIVIGIRRVWIGQSSDSEHKRAVGLASKEGNAQWVYNNVAGSPRGWRDEIPPSERKTVYFLMIIKNQ